MARNCYIPGHYMYHSAKLKNQKKINAPVKKLRVLLLKLSAGQQVSETGRPTDAQSLKPAVCRTFSLCNLLSVGHLFLISNVLSLIFKNNYVLLPLTLIGHCILGDIQILYSYHDIQCPYVLGLIIYYINIIREIHIGIKNPGYWRAVPCGTVVRSADWRVVFNVE